MSISRTFVFARVLRTKIGSDADGDCFEDVYTEIDTNFCVDVANTKDGKVVTVNSNSRTSSEVKLSVTHSYFFQIQVKCFL